MGKTSITEIAMLRDGGTITFDLKTEVNSMICGCIDNRLGTKSKNRVYLGSKDPSSEEASMIEVGSDSEKSIVNALEVYLKVKPSDKRKIELAETALKRIQSLKGYSQKIRSLLVR